MSKQSKQSPKYVLIYFPLRGRAELARLVFAAAGVEYEDRRVAGEEWQKLKPSEYMYMCTMIYHKD